MESTDISQLLEASRQGDREAFDQVFSLVYDELRMMARRRSRRQAHATLDTTALVHEAYVKLAGATVHINDRRHFLALSASAMRQVVVDYARERSALKRGSAEVHLTLTGIDELPSVNVEEQAALVLSINLALEQLSAVDERAAQVVEMRFFGGLSVDETALALAISTATVKRDARVARAFLSRQLATSPTQAPPDEP